MVICSYIAETRSADSPTKRLPGALSDPHRYIAITIRSEKHCARPYRHLSDKSWPRHARIYHPRHAYIYPQRYPGDNHPRALISTL